MKKIYLDNGSTAFPKVPLLSETIADFIEHSCYNVNRGNYEDAYSVGFRIIETRKLLADFFNCLDPKNVIFTSGITQAINVVVKGLVNEGDHIITTSMEHNAVVRVLKQIEDKAEISFVAANSKGQFNLNSFKDALQPNSRILLVNHVSNVFGTILDVEELGAWAKEVGLIMIVDCAQSAGHLDIDMERDNIDVLCFTGHKGLLGLQGVGGFIVKEHMIDLIRPVNVGGSGSSSDSDIMPDFLPDKYEAGTLNLAGIISLNHSLKYIKNETIEKIHEKEMALASLFINELLDVDNIILYNEQDLKNNTAIISIGFTNIDNAQAAFILDSEYNIMIRCGLHCAFMAHQTMNSYPNGTLRFVFGYFNTVEEVEKAIEAIKHIASIKE